MKLTVLMENTACCPGLETAHGLSVYLETDQHRLLMDVGPGEEFLHNARTLGVDLEKVDLCAISHGHDDHGGGLRTFLEVNHQAPVYLSKLAFGRFFSQREEISLDPGLKGHPQVRLTEALTVVDQQITLFSQIPGDQLLPAANRTLLDEQGPDSFLHEQGVLVREGDKLLLLGGCAHRGIVNILEQAKKLAGRYPDAVLSGFHLAAGGTGRCLADDDYLDALSARLLDTGAMFYTCHCTGTEALARLKERMGDALQGVSAGTVLEI